MPTSSCGVELVNKQLGDCRCPTQVVLTQQQTAKSQVPRKPRRKKGKVPKVNTKAPSAFDSFVASPDSSTTTSNSCSIVENFSQKAKIAQTSPKAGHLLHVPTSSETVHHSKGTGTGRLAMGACSAKHGANASRSKSTEGPTAVTTMSPTHHKTSPVASKPVGPSLKIKERRRLSLSKSGPVRDANVSDARGGLLFALPAGTRPESEMAEAITSTTPTVATSPSLKTNARGTRATMRRRPDAGLPRRPPVRAAAAHSQNSPAVVRPLPVEPKRCRRLSVTGAPAAGVEDNFENKRQEVKSDTGYFDSQMLASLGIGYTCKKGLKPESPNQDDFFIVRVGDWAFSPPSQTPVALGHGPYGHDVSNFVQRELPRVIYNDANFLINPGEALKNSFITVHDMLEEAAATLGTFDCSLSGTTATVVLHRRGTGKLYVAHVGDSRCILGRVGDERKVEAIDLTIDHKPSSESERRRIHAAGGQVRRLEGDIPHRVFIKGRLYPGLAMSRAIGDSVGRQAGIICEPDILEYTINAERDLFICLCSDGVWEFLDSEEVASVILAHGAANVQDAADALARESWRRWIEEEGNVVDDITAQIIFLSPDCSMMSQ